MDNSAPAPKRVSIRDVAEAVGVSHTAVSLALRHHPSISVKTRDQICERAKEMGYRPDADMAKLMERMRSKRRKRLGNVIAYITAFAERDAWKEIGTHRLYYESALARAEECGFKLEEFWLREKDLTARRLGDILRSRAVENVLIAPLPGQVNEQQKWFNGFPWDYFSVVALGYSLTALAVNRVSFNHYEGMTMLMRELVKRGYRRPGLSMSQSLDDRTHNYYRSAYLNELSLTKFLTEIPVDIKPDWNLEGFEVWFRKHKPDVVITFDGGVAQKITDMGYKVPKDVGVVLIDLPNAPSNHSGMKQNSHYIASSAVDLLLSMNRIDDRGIPEIPRVLMSEGTFLEGETLRD